MDDLYEHQRRYYHLRAREYDAGAWEPQAPEEAEEVSELVGVVASLPPARTLDVACGTGFLTRHLRGELTLLDASEDMLAIAASRVVGAHLVRGDALPLPFADQSFDRIFCSQFYGHLLPAERKVFVAEARRVAAELVLVEQTRGPEHREGPEQRALRDGSVHEIYTAYFSAASLVAELHDRGELLHDGRSFLVTRTEWV